MESKKRRSNLTLSKPKSYSDEILRCSNDILHWVRNYCWGYDPRLEGEKYTKFDPWPKQEELFLWLQESERLKTGGLIEKARDSGVTYACVDYALHGWLFRNGFSAGFGSRKLELVDKLGDPDSIFEKLRIVLYRLPSWQLPEGFNPREHDSFAKLINPANGATITGEGGDEIGRGGRKAIYFVDESAFIERAERVDRALSGTTNVRIDISTPNRPGDLFARRRFNPRTRVFTFHWRDDPRKTDEWAMEKKSDIGSVAWAQEVLEKSRSLVYQTSNACL